MINKSFSRDWDSEKKISSNNLVSKLKKFNLEDYFEKKIKRWNYSMGRITNTKRTQTMKQNIEIDDTLK